MFENDLMVALFALVFLAFCLTAIALFALSRNKDDVAEEATSALRDLKMGGLKTRAEPDDIDENERPNTENG